MEMFDQVSEYCIKIIKQEAGIHKYVKSPIYQIMVNLNPWITEQKYFLHLRNWICFVHTFLKLTSQHFFQCPINRINLNQNVSFIQILLFYAII
jgi:hypothetical protein